MSLFGFELFTGNPMLSTSNCTFALEPVGMISTGLLLLLMVPTPLYTRITFSFALPGLVVAYGLYPHSGT